MRARAYARGAGDGRVHPIKFLVREKSQNGKKTFRAPTFPPGDDDDDVRPRELPRSRCGTRFLFNGKIFEYVEPRGIARHVQFERRFDTVGKVGGRGWSRKSPVTMENVTPLLRRVTPATFELINLVLAVSYPLSSYVSIEGEIERLTLLADYPSDSFGISDHRRELVTP